MTLGEMMDLLTQYIEQGNVDLDADVTVAVFHDDETAEEYPATMVSARPGNAVNIWADAQDNPERN